MRFADTSILLYAISRDPAGQDKAKRANDILAERDLALSVQATRASRPDAIGHRQAVLDARHRFQLSYWDAAIIEASRAMGCTQVLSETSATARTMAASGSPTRSAGKDRTTCVVIVCIMNCGCVRGYPLSCGNSSRVLPRAQGFAGLEIGGRGGAPRACTPSVAGETDGGRGLLMAVWPLPCHVGCPCRHPLGSWR